MSGTERALKFSKIICFFIGHKPIKKFIDDLFEGIPDGYTELVFCSRCLKTISTRFFVDVSDKTKKQAIALSEKYGLTEIEMMSMLLNFWEHHDLNDPRSLVLFSKYLKEQIKTK